MLNKLKEIIDFTYNMGLRYILFRSVYILKSKIGWKK